jgi:tetratricopeptide (TPR) repeat protein
VSDSLPTVDGFSSPSAAQRIDGLADRFEAALKAGGQPSIEQFLAEVPEADRVDLLPELIVIDVTYRRQRGEGPRPQDYRQRFPSLELAVLGNLIAGAGAAPASSAGNHGPEAPETQVPERGGHELLTPPFGLGRYRVTATLGSGSFGTVYRAFDDEHQRPVAIKVPHRHLLASPENVAAYLAEARVLASLDHVGILPVYDVGRTEEGLCYLVSKYAESSDLARRIARGRPPFEESAALVAAVAEALHHAHQRGLVHRDVKPANILLDAAGRPVLADFGLALRDQDFGKGPGIAGTAAYMSPEQARGEAHRVDGRTDVHSLGAVFYELLTGRRPFRGDSLDEILEQVKTLEPRPPRQLDDRIPRELERICLKALAKRLPERYPTALDLAEELRRWLVQGRAGDAPARPAPVHLGASDTAAVLQTEIHRLRQELIDQGKRRRELAREPIVGLRFLDVGEAFKDRTFELALLRQQLANPAVKLVCVAGRAGIGKTSLVSKLCAEVERGELRLSATAAPAGADGIVYASCRGPERPTVERLYHDIGRMLGEPLAGELAACWRDPCRHVADKTRLLLAKLRGGYYLLVLDNLEDALAADHTLADAELRAFVDLCLTTPHGLRLLLTSRTPLRVAGPGIKAVRTLALDAGLPPADAVALLRDFDPDGALHLRDAPDDLLRQAAARCHGVPRALESVAGILAADPTLILADLLASAPLFTEQVVENLVSERHRQADAAQRHILETLAVFNRSVPAAAVCFLLHPFFPGLDVDGGLQALARGYSVTHHRGHDTYELHPLDQEYAYARLDDEGPYSKPALHRRAAEFYAELGKPETEWKALCDVQPQLDQLEHLLRAGAFGAAFWLTQQIDFEHLAVWGHSELVIALRNRLAGNLGHVTLEWHNRYMLGLAYYRLWSPEEAIRCLRTVLAMVTGRSADIIADVKGNLGRALLLVGQSDEAVQLLEEAIQVMRRLGSRAAEGLWSGRLGEALLRLGRVEEALSCHAFALKTSQDANDLRWQITHLSNLGEAHRKRGDREAAMRYLQQGLDLATSTGNRQGQAYCALRLARVLHETGLLDLAGDYYGQALQAELPPCHFLAAIHLGILSLETGKLKAAPGYLAAGADLCRGLLSKTPRLYDALYGLALAHMASGQPDQSSATYCRALAVCPAKGVVQEALDDLRQLQRIRPPLAGLDPTVRLLEQASLHPAAAYPADQRREDDDPSDGINRNVRGPT